MKRLLRFGIFFKFHSYLWPLKLSILATPNSSVGLPICLRERFKAISRSLCDLLEVEDMANISSSGSSVKCSVDIEGISFHCLVDLWFGIGFLCLVEVVVPWIGVEVAKCSEAVGLLGLTGLRNGGLNVGLEELDPLVPLIVEEAAWFLSDG